MTTTLSSYAKEYAKAAGLLFAGTVVSYFLTYHSTLSPPVKPRDTIFGISVIIEIFGVLFGFNVSKKFAPPLVPLISFAVLYFVALFSLTFLVPTSSSSYREAIGITCKKAFLELYGPNCYWIDPDILAKTSFEANRIWELWSVDIVRMTLGGLWLVMVFFLVATIALSVRQSAGRTKASRSASQKVGRREAADSR